jgi:hypothetical protein
MTMNKVSSVAKPVTMRFRMVQFFITIGRFEVR